LAGLLITELILRVAGFGHPCSFFVQSQVAGKRVLIENTWFGLRFFPPALARSPNPAVMEAEKSAGVYRIFLFGESAALGDPRPAYGVGRYLEVLLRRRFPGKEFEVVCVAMTAINSHAIVPIARECARYKGDLWIVYMGNNEFIGPFGANSVFGPEAPPNFLVRVYLSLQESRVGQALVALERRLSRSESEPANWSGLRMFLGHQVAPSDPRKDRVYQNFRGNLRDILEEGVKAGAPIILSSVACNLKDCPPFDSLQPSSLDAASWQRWKLLCERGAGKAEQGHFAEAIQDFSKALEISPQNAELQFRMAECYLGMTNLKSAGESFEQARDWDTLPFRVDRRINEEIARAGERYKGKGVSYVNAAKVLAPFSTSRIPGNESFYEHVHLSCEGNYRLARAFADEVATRLARQDWGIAAKDWAEAETCERDLGLTDWNRYAALEEISRRLLDAPYTNQLNHAQRREKLQMQMSALKAQLQPIAIEKSRDVYQQALKKRPKDHWLHHNYAEFLTTIGDWGGATQQMEEVCKLVPEHYAAYLQLGRLLALQKRYDEALRPLETAHRLRPDLTDVYLELGQVYSRQGKLDTALEQYALVLKSQPDNAGVRLLIAQILEKQSKRQEAIQSLRDAIHLQASFCEAHDLLGIELGLEGKQKEAEAEFEAVVRLRPERADGHLNLGISLARQERYQEALEQFEEALRLDPQNAKAREFVATLEQRGIRQATPQ
jgi:tetratricopeptide (TPR) repeat protein